MTPNRPAAIASRFTRPPRYGETAEAVNALRDRYRQLKLFPIGKSVLGRDINALCVGDPAGATLFVGGIHGGEWMSSLLLIQFCADLLEALDTGGTFSDIDVRKALQNRSVAIVPCLNPDGAEIALAGPEGAPGREDFVEELGNGGTALWQANANGVDLSHNFDAGWEELREQERREGTAGPAPARYGGPHPHSEPETEAIVTFCHTFRPRTLYSLQIQGNFTQSGEIHYRYGKHTPARSRMIAQILASSSGYALARPAGKAGGNSPASLGNLKDWFIDKLHRPGFTVEGGRGHGRGGLEQLRPAYARLEEMLILATLL